MTLCIIGGAGFVGNRTLMRMQGPVRALAHRRALDVPDTVEGDAADPAVLAHLLEPGAVVLNLAYEAARAEKLAEALGAACATRGVRRLVHVSTSSVYGAAPGALIDENTQCAPRTSYERAKHAVEDILERHAAGRFELVLLRPTAVFGPGGRNLEALAMRVLREGWPRRYIRACAMGRRHMHAVDVEYVAAAALFLVAAPLDAAVERFIVSQDEEPMNNYRSLEDFFVARFAAAPYPVPPLSVPPAALRVALRIAGRSDVEPRRRYSGARLRARGFREPRPFGAALEEYARWIGRHARP